MAVQEVSFKQDPSDFRTLDPAKWTISVNGGRSFTLDDILTLGSYSCLIGDQAFFCSSKLGETSVYTTALYQSITQTLCACSGKPTTIKSQKYQWSSSLMDMHMHLLITQLM